MYYSSTQKRTQNLSHVLKTIWLYLPLPSILPYVLPPASPHPHLLPQMHLHYTDTPVVRRPSAEYTISASTRSAPALSGSVCSCAFAFSICFSLSSCTFIARLSSLSIEASKMQLHCYKQLSHCFHRSKHRLCNGMFLLFL